MSEDIRETFHSAEYDDYYARLDAKAKAKYDYVEAVIKTQYVVNQKFVKSLEGTVILAGFRHPVLPYVASSDFGILASIVREGCPLSPQEYMSQGRPVVTTDNGGQKEYVVNGENGFMVTPGDSAKLAEAMSVLINDAEKRQQMGMKAKEDFFDHMDYEHFYVQIKKLYGSYL